MLYVSKNGTIEQEIIAVLQVDVLNKWTNLLVLMVFPVLFHFLAYLSTIYWVGLSRRGSNITRFFALFRKKETVVHQRTRKESGYGKRSLSRRSSQSEGMVKLRARVASSSTTSLFWR